MSDEAIYFIGHFGYRIARKDERCLTILRVTSREGTESIPIVPTDDPEGQMWREIQAYHNRVCSFSSWGYQYPDLYTYEQYCEMIQELCKEAEIEYVEPIQEWGRTHEKIQEENAEKEEATASQTQAMPTAQSE